MDTLTHGSWVRGALVVALVVDILGQLVGVVPAGSVGMALSVTVVGVVAACAWVAVRCARPSAAHARGEWPSRTPAVTGGSGS
jgi:hypothetical protein